MPASEPRVRSGTHQAASRRDMGKFGSGVHTASRLSLYMASPSIGSDLWHSTYGLPEVRDRGPFNHVGARDAPPVSPPRAGSRGSRASWIFPVISDACPLRHLYD